MSEHDTTGQDLPTAGRSPDATPDPEKTITPGSVEYVRPAPGAALAPAEQVRLEQGEPSAPGGAEPAGPPESAQAARADPADAEPPRPADEETTRLDRPAAAEDDLDGPTRELDRPAREPAGGGDALDRVIENTGASDVREKQAGPPTKPPPRQRISSAGALIGVLLALFGFTLVVQLRSNDGDQGLATARQEDLVRILSDLEARDSRLQSEISALETSQRQLTSGVAGRQAALAEAEKRADELGLLAGTKPGVGPGLVITMAKVKASAILNAVQELRGAGGEVMQIAGANGQTVRVVASSYFVDAEGGGIIADGSRLTGPYQLSVIGQPQTMQTALQIPGGVVASVNSGGGSVTMEQRGTVEVTAVRKATTLQYARPAS